MRRDDSTIPGAAAEAARQAKAAAADALANAKREAKAAAAEARREAKAAATEAVANARREAKAAAGEAVANARRDALEAVANARREASEAIASAARAVSEATGSPPGHRERKKAQTRQRISDIATELFMERGFDAVTVADVAAAADVSVKTVFNYFGTKEDLLFDREAAWLASIDAFGELRRPGYGLVRVIADDVEVRWPGMAFGEWSRFDDEMADGRRRFYGMIDAHPTLRARRLRMLDRQRRRFLDLVLLDLPGAPSPEAETAAALINGAYQAVGNAIYTGALEGQDAATIVATAKAVGVHAFEVLARAYAGTALVDGPPDR